jgi:hypothetical protein
MKEYNNPPREASRSDASPSIIREGETPSNPGSLEVHRSTLSSRSAGLQPAVSPIFNRQTLAPTLNAPLSGAPVDFMDRSLVGRLDDHFINTYMRRTRGHPDHGLSHVFGPQRMSPLVNLFGTLDVAFKSDQ